MTSDAPPSTIIIGGGLAGLAAAAALAERGVRVTLLESRPRLGGRASSFVDRATGAEIDNCQHVSMECCTNFSHFCRTTGLADHFRTADVLYFVGPNGRIHEFRAAGWPAPFHLAGAFRRLAYLSNRDRLAIARGLRHLARYRTTSDTRSFAEWLLDHRQTPGAIENFWRVVLVSALSESLERIDVGYARKVFVDSFLSNRDGWKVQIPTAPLNELYGARLTDWLAARGVAVRLQAGVERMHACSDRVTAVDLRGGERLDADHFVLAVPHQAAPALMPPGLADHPDLAGIARLESAPIASVHLWFDRPITDLPHAVFVGRLSQWMFQKTGVRSQETGDRRDASLEQALDEASGSPLSSDSRLPVAAYYQIVISASRELGTVPAERTIETVVNEVAAVWPATCDAKLLHSRLVTEHRAVFSPRPGVDALRPRQQSPIANLQLAGDWTRTGWPATMEGAVRSGYLAAENILAHLERPERLVQPDLPGAYLSELLLGIRV